MKKMRRTLFALVLVAAASMPLAAQMMGGGTANNNPTVGGAPMYRTKNIVEKAMNPPTHRTRGAGVTAAGLLKPLQARGPFTVFAPPNSAWEKLPAGTVETLVRPENK